MIINCISKACVTKDNKINISCQSRDHTLCDKLVTYVIKHVVHHYY